MASSEPSFKGIADMIWETVRITALIRMNGDVGVMEAPLLVKQTARDRYPHITLVK